MSGKRIVKAREGIERTKLYPVDQAIKLVRERATCQIRRNRRNRA